MPSRKWFVIAVGLVAAVALSTLTLLAVSERGLFELDGNAKYDASGSGEDWQTVNAPGYVHDGLNGHAVAITGVVADMHTSPPDPTAFFNKQTKDIVDIPGNWTWKATNVPDKDDIDNAYAAAYIDPNGGDLIITFGADRYSAGNGDAFLGFWFFQDQVGPTSGGTFSGKHVEGDLLVLVNFQGGGSVPKVQVLEWVPGGGDVATNLLLKYSNDAALCGSDSGLPACAVTNSQPVSVYWPFDYKGEPYCDKSDGTCVAPPLAFFEGAINVTDLFGDGDMPCITNFLAETRSSSSVTADLKDFVAHSFPLCGIGISKACGTQVSNGSSVTYTNSITVTNTGIGTLYDALVTDEYQTGATTHDTRYFAASAAACVGHDPCTVVAGLGQLASKDSVTFDEQYASGLLTSTDTATVAARPGLSAEVRTVVPTGPASAECGLAVTPSVKVTKECDKVELVEVGGTLQVKVTVKGTIENTSTGTNITLTSISDNPVVASIPLGKTTLALGESTTFGPFSYFPATVSIGTCPAGSYCFTDVVTVYWSAVLGGATGNSEGQATCALCPTCPPCGSNSTCHTGCPGAAAVASPAGRR